MGEEILTHLLTNTMGSSTSKVAPLPQEKPKFVDSRLIRPPPCGKTLWSAMRVRNFMRRIKKDPMWRGKYLNNITYMASLLNMDPYVFMYAINPILFGKSLGWSNQEIYRLIGRHNWAILMKRINNSSCEECRLLGESC